MSGAVLIALAGVATLGLIAWHMRRPNWRMVRFSGLQFLPDMSPTRQKQQRWRLQLPLGSAAFWLRMLVAAAAIWAIWMSLAAWSDRTPDTRFNLRIIVDGSASMSAGGPARFAAARQEAATVLVSARKAAEDRETCTSLHLVGRNLVDYSHAGPDALSLETANPAVIAPAQLLARAQGDIRAACAPDHVVIISDAPKPVGAPDHVIWRMIGAPVANVALTSATLERPGLLSGDTILDLRISPSGETAGRAVLRLQGPNGILPQQSVDLSGLPPFAIRLPIFAPGTYRASLVDGGGLAVDDRIEIDIPQLDRPPLDWRLTGLPAPYAATGGEPVIVGELAQLSEADRASRFVGVTAPWAGTKSEIGVFVDDAPLLSNLNLDALAAFGPGTLPTPLPDGFSPVATADPSGLPLFSHRRSPRAVLVPDPSGAPDPESRKLALTVFYNALEWVLEVPATPLPVAWLQPDGSRWSNAALESDTGRPLAESDPLRFDAPARPDEPPATGQPFWPLLLALALLALALERSLSAARSLRGSGDRV